jgi:two-component system NtrC family sensor kinase
MASILNRIGNIYMELKEYKTAIDYYRQSQALCEKMADSGAVYNEVSNIGNIYELMGTLDSSQIYQQRVFDFSIHNTDRNAITYGEMRARLGNVESRLGNYETALTHYRFGIKESLTDFDFRNLAFNYIQMAKLFSFLGLYDSSFYYARKTIETGKSISFKKAIYEASGLMSGLFKRKQLTDSALHYYELSNAYKDSLYGPKIFQKLQLIALNEQQRQQELQKENEELQNRFRLIVSLSVLFVVILIALILWFNFKKQKKTNLKLTLQKKQIEERTLQLVEESAKSHLLVSHC